MPEIRFDLHGRRHLTVADVRPSAPLCLSICAWAATEPWAPINPIMLPVVGMVTRQGREWAVIPGWKVG